MSDLRHNVRSLGNLCFAFGKTWHHDVHPDIPQRIEISTHEGMVVHGLVHGRHQEDGHALAQCSRGKGCDGRVVNTAGNLPDGVCRSRRNDDQISSPLDIARQSDVLNGAGELSDRAVSRGPFQEIGVNESFRFRRHDREDLGAVAHDLPRQLYAFHRGYTARNAEGNALPGERLRNGSQNVA